MGLIFFLPLESRGLGAVLAIHLRCSSCGGSGWRNTSTGSGTASRTFNMIA